MDIGILNAIFKADVAEFVRDVGKAAYAMEKTQKQIEGAVKGINRAMGAITGGVITTAVFKRIIDEASQAESAAKKVDAVLRATGGAAGVTSKQVDELADSYSKLTGVDDDVIKGGEALLLTFKGIGKDVFPQATGAMLDMAEMMGTDLKSAAITLGKALDNPTKGMVALQKQGLGFSEAQTKVIKSMQQTGHLADAQREILKALEGQIGGVAAAARDTLEGALKALDTAFGNLFETIGTGAPLDALRLGIEETITVLQRFTDYIDNAIKPSLVELKAQMDAMFGGDSLAMIGNFFAGLTNLFIASAKTLNDLIFFGAESINQVMKNGFDDNVAKSLLNDFLGNAKEYFKTDFVGGIKDGLKDIDNETRTRMDNIAQRAARAGKHSKDSLQAGLNPFDKKFQQQFEKDLNDLLKPLKNSKFLPSAYDFTDELKKRQIAGKDFSRDPIAEASIRRGEGLKDLYSELDALDLEFIKKSQLAKLDGDAVIRLEAREKAHKAFPLDLEAETNAYNRLYEAMARNQALESETEWKKKVEGIHEETEALKAKVEGREEEYKLLKAIREIEKDPYLSPQKKLEMAGAISKELDAQKKLNDQYDAQKDLLKKISDGAESYRTKVKELDDAVKKHLLTQKQANDALKDLNNNQLKKFQSGFKSFTNSIMNDLTQVITGGKKFNDVLKDIGMRVAQLAAQKLLFDPIANALTNYASKIYGGTLAQPGGGTPGTIMAGGLGGMLSKLFGKPGTTGSGSGGFAPITGNGQSTTANSSTPGILTAGGLAPGVALTGSYDALGRIDSFVTGAQVMTVEGLALRVKIAREPIKPLTAGERKLLSGGGGGSGPVEEDPVVKYLRRFEGQSKGGPAWRVIEPDCPCPTISQLFPKATGTGSASAGSSGDVNFNSDEMQPLTALLGLTGLAGILSALKGGDSAGHLESLVGGLATVLQEISNKLSSILGAMCPCLPPPSCACGPGGSGSPGGYAGGGPGVPGSLPFGAPDNSVNEAARAAHAAQANAAQAAVMNKPGPANQYLTPQQTVQQYNNAQYADQMRLRNISAANAWGPATGNLVMQQQASWQTAMNTLNAQAASGQLWGYTSDYFKSDPNSYTKPFVMQGSPYSAMEPIYDTSSSFTPGLTGGVNKTAMYSDWNSGGGNVVQDWTRHNLLPSINAYPAPRGYVPDNRTPMYDSPDIVPGVIGGPPIYLNGGLKATGLKNGATMIGSGGGYWQDIVNNDPFKITGANGQNAAYPPSAQHLSTGMQAAPGTYWQGNQLIDQQTGTILVDLGNRGRAGKLSTQMAKGSIQSNAINNVDFQTLLNHATYPKRGTGGPAGPDGPVFVGDRGTELFMPQDPGRVVSNDQIAAALRSGGGAPNVQIHNNGHPIDVHSTDWDGRTLKMAVGSLATALPNDAAFQRASKRTAPPRNG